MRTWLHGKMLATQAQGPEFGYPAPMSKARPGTMYTIHPPSHSKHHFLMLFRPYHKQQACTVLWVEVSCSTKLCVQKPNPSVEMMEPLRCSI